MVDIMFDVEAIEAEYFTLDEFKFNNGEVLKDAKVEYITFGTPGYDENGIISNAVIYFHGSSGSCYSARRISEDMGSGEIILLHFSQCFRMSWFCKSLNNWSYE